MKISLESTAARPSFSIRRTVMAWRSNSVKKSVMPLERPGGIAVARAREEQDAIGVLRVGGPHLAPVDEPAIALLLCPRLDARGVGARVGLGDPEGHHGLARHDLRELALLELVRPVAHHGLGREAVEVDGGGAR